MRNFSNLINNYNILLVETSHAFVTSRTVVYFFIIASLYFIFKPDEW